MFAQLSYRRAALADTPAGPPPVQQVENRDALIALLREELVSRGWPHPSYWATVLSRDNGLTEVRDRMTFILADVLEAAKVKQRNGEVMDRVWDGLKDRSSAAA